MTRRRITYKAVGDGFQADVLCYAGYIYQVYYLRNEIDSFELFETRFVSPSFTNYGSFCDLLKDDYHQVGMDNLYNPATFCRAAYNHPRKFLCHGVHSIVLLYCPCTRYIGFALIVTVLSSIKTKDYTHVCIQFVLQPM